MALQQSHSVGCRSQTEWAIRFMQCMSASCDHEGIPRALGALAGTLQNSQIKIMHTQQKTSRNTSAQCYARCPGAPLRPGMAAPMHASHPGDEAEVHAGPAGKVPHLEPPLVPNLDLQDVEVAVADRGVDQLVPAALIAIGCREKGVAHNRHMQGPRLCYC